MLTEFPRLSQHADGYRRLFADDYFDLYVWYDTPEGAPTGFQLNYSVNDKPRSLTCRVGGSCTHAGIDEGDAPGHYKGSPILVGDGVLDKDQVLNRFLSAAGDLEPSLVAMVADRLRAYENPA